MTEPVPFDALDTVTVKTWVALMWELGRFPRVTDVNRSDAELLGIRHIGPAALADIRRAQREWWIAHPVEVGL